MEKHVEFDTCSQFCEIAKCVGASPPIIVVQNFYIFVCLYASLLFSNTVITLFSSWKNFWTALIIRKFVTRILFQYEEFLHWDFIIQ